MHSIVSPFTRTILLFPVSEITKIGSLMPSYFSIHIILPGNLRFYDFALSRSYEFSAEFYLFIFGILFLFSSNISGIVLFLFKVF